MFELLIESLLNICNITEFYINIRSQNYKLLNGSVEI